MPSQHIPESAAVQLCRQHKLALPESPDFAPDNLGHLHPACDTDYQRERTIGRPAPDSLKHDNQQDIRNTHTQVCRLHHQIVDVPVGHAAEGSVNRSYECREQSAQCAYYQARSATMQDEAQQVSSHVIRTKYMSHRRCLPDYI